MRLRGKRVLITGTAGGQGEAAQRIFAAEGARIVGCDIQDGAAERTAKELRRSGFDVSGDTVDLSDGAAAGRWVESAGERLGGIDVLYNNAAGFGFTPFAEMTHEFFRRVLSVELEIVFNTISPAWPHLIDGGGGSIINTASFSALRGVASIGQVAHAAAKGGVIAMSRALAAEGAEAGVRVNAISPGFVKSPAADAAVEEGESGWLSMNHLSRRAGTVEDVAHLALYLASDESSWVSGQNYSIDGGATAGFN